ncbi:MAG: NUDIX domain-containing protein [bacterium]|nr:NUDIX domain-containing protein [bacterium]
MHEVQKHILKRLSLVDKSRYAELKPRTVEGNLFVYHLRSLMRSGLVASTEDGYCLTPKGKLLIDRISFETFNERIQPKIVTLLVVENENKYLLYKRRRAPFIGRVGFTYGKIHLEERLREAAERELFEKTNLKADLKHRGDVYITVHDETELVSHMLCHVFTGTKSQGVLRTDTTIGECYWGKLEDVKDTDLIPGVKQIAKLLKKKKEFFFAEYFLNTSDE